MLNFRCRVDDVTTLGQSRLCFPSWPPPRVEGTVSVRGEDQPRISYTTVLTSPFLNVCPAYASGRHHVDLDQDFDIGDNSIVVDSRFVEEVSTFS